VDASFLQSLVTGIHIRSNYGPDIDVADPFSPSPTTTTEGRGSATLLSKLQPQVVFDTAGGPIVLNPYGTPGPTRWEEVLTGATFFGSIAVGLSLYGLYKLTLGR
jgi:hypothetical protein